MEDHRTAHDGPRAIIVVVNAELRVVGNHLKRTKARAGEQPADIGETKSSHLERLPGASMKEGIAEDLHLAVLRPVDDAGLTK